MSMTTGRRATIEVEQLINGYWRAAIRVQVPNLPTPFEDSGDAFHNAGDALEWARQTIEGYTLSIGPTVTRP